MRTAGSYVGFVIHGDVNVRVSIVHMDLHNVTHSDFLAQTGEET